MKENNSLWHCPHADTQMNGTRAEAHTRHRTVMLQRRSIGTPALSGAVSNCESPSEIENPLQVENDFS